MITSSFAAILVFVAGCPSRLAFAQSVPATTCPAYAHQNQKMATDYLDTLFSKHYNASLEYWAPNGTWWTLGTKAVVPWAGFSTIEEHTPIMAKQLEPYTSANYYPWNWVIADFERQLTVEMWLDWEGPNVRYQTNATCTMKFDEHHRITELHEYLDLTQAPEIL